MVDVIQAIATLGSLLLLAGAAYAMHLFFGWVGVALFLGMAVPVALLAAKLSGGDEPGGGSGRRAQRQSKGARQHER